MGEGGGVRRERKVSLLSLLSSPFPQKQLILRLFTPTDLTALYTWMDTLTKR